MVRYFDVCGVQVPTLENAPAMSFNVHLYINAFRCQNGMMVLKTVRMGLMKVQSSVATRCNQ